MTSTRDLEQERRELLRQIEAALSAEVRLRLQAASRLPQEPKVMLSNNEMGSEYADKG